jgi:hypothetical protein
MSPAAVEAAGACPGGDPVEPDPNTPETPEREDALAAAPRAA